MKLKEANKQRTYIAAVKDLDFWLGEVESLLTSEDAGRDLASVQNLMKKHQLVEADIQHHEDRIKGKWFRSPLSHYDVALYMDKWLIL